MSNVHCLPNVTDIDPTALLEMAKDWGMNEVLIIGRNPDRDFLWGSSTNDSAKLILLLAIAQTTLMRTVVPDDQ